VAIVKTFGIEFKWIIEGIHMRLFRQTGFSDFDFNIGSSSEYVLVGSDHVVFSAGGILQRISITAPDKGSTGSWRIESLVEDETNVLYEGNFIQVEERFRLIKNRARDGSPANRRTTFMSLLMVSLLTAVSACALLGMTHRHDSRSQVSGQDQVDFSELVDAMKMTGMDYSHLLPSLAERSEASPEALRQAGKEPIQMVPDLKPQVDAKQGSESAAQTPGLPKYSPDLYKDDQRLPVEKPAEKAAAGNVSQAAPVSKPGTDLDTEIAAELKKLSPTEAAEVLQKISMLTPGQMKGDALASLPPNLRSLIERTNAEASAGSVPTKPAPGIVTTDEKGVPTKLIMLPPKVIDDYRTHDGISSIPENSSWQARGNPTVHIPLPGGGDIQSVSDLEKFGLKP
jgi:hypothetical protein